MRVKDLIKKLKTMPQDAQVGMNVITPNTSEFWCIKERAVTPMDGGQTVCLFQVRQRKPLPKRAVLKMSIPAIDSADCTFEDVFERLDERYDFDCDMKKVKECTDKEVISTVFEVIHEDIAELIRLEEDFSNLLHNPNMTREYTVEIFDKNQVAK